MKLRLDPFGMDALARYAQQRGVRPSAVLRVAISYYLADRGEHRAAWSVPRFLRGPDADAGDASEIEVHLDSDAVGAVTAEAERQGVEAELLARHALLYLLADLESGRAASRLADAFEEDDD